MNHPISYEEYLQQHETLTYTCVGVSMLPLLHEGDLFTVQRKGSARCRRSDVVLYRRGRDYVLHRIVEVRPKDYVILGDNCITKEYGTTDADILGVMTEFVRNGKQHTTRDRGYRFYSWWIVHTIGLRVFLKKCRRKGAKLLRRILHGKNR